MSIPRHTPIHKHNACACTCARVLTHTHTHAHTRAHTHAHTHAHTWACLRAHPYYACTQGPSSDPSQIPKWDRLWLTKGAPVPKHDLHLLSQALVLLFRNTASLYLVPSHLGATLGTRIEHGGGSLRSPWKLIDSYGTCPYSNLHLLCQDHESRILCLSPTSSFPHSCCLIKYIYF